MKYIIIMSLVIAACSSSIDKGYPQKASSSIQNRPQKTANSKIASTTQSEDVQTSTIKKVNRNSRLEYEWYSKISVNEGGFNIEEAERILQTLENMRDMRSDKSLLNAMYTQSARVTRRKEFTDSRQVWVSYLPMTGNNVPENGWIECTETDPVTKKPLPRGCTGNWKSTSDKWTEFREKTREIYYSGVIPNVLPGKPIQWGGNMDYWRGVGRGFCPLNNGSLLLNTFWGDVRDPENDGKCLPIIEKQVESSRTLSAKIASGRSARMERMRNLSGEGTQESAENTTPTMIPETPTVPSEGISEQL